MAVPGGLSALPGETGEAESAKTLLWPSWDCGHPFPGVTQL